MITVSQREAQSTHTQLTERQLHVLRGIFEGLTNKEIATDLGVSESAVKATVQQLFRRMRVRTRAQLVRIALEGSLLDQRR
jgi:two-component system nitrate/nitrite response regulator NarL